MATAEESRHFMLSYYLMLYGILYYDYLVTLHKEYRRIWLSPWSTVKVIYFINRYLMLLESILIFIGFGLQWPQSKCEKSIIRLQAFLPVVISASGGILLLLRTHAIWCRARWVLYVLCPVLTIQLSTSIWLAATQVGALPFPGGIGPCMTYAPSKLMDLYCILPMIYDLIASGLFVYRGVSLRRKLGNLTSTVFLNFTRHGTYYAIGTALANAMNLGFMTITTRYVGLPTVPSNGGLLCAVFSSVFISRLALSLKSDINRDISPSKACLLPLENLGPRASSTSSRYPLLFEHQNYPTHHEMTAFGATFPKQSLPELAKAYIREDTAGRTFVDRHELERKNSTTFAP